MAMILGIFGFLVGLALLLDGWFMKVPWVTPIVLGGMTLTAISEIVWLSGRRAPDRIGRLLKEGVVSSGQE